MYDFRQYKAAFIVNAAWGATCVVPTNLEAEAFKTSVLAAAQSELLRRSNELQELEGLAFRFPQADVIRAQLDFLREDVRELREGLADLL